MKLKPIKLVPVCIGLGAISMACLVQGLLGHSRLVQLFQRLEWITFDWRMRAANEFHPPVSDKLGFVFIGDDAITVFSQGLLGTNLQFGLKWPRHVYGRVVRELKAQGAKAIGMDIFFAERRYDHIKDNGRFDPDLIFAQQLKQASNVVLGATSQILPDPLFLTRAAELGDLSKELDSDGVLRRDWAFHDCRIWHPSIQHEAALRGWDLASSQIETNRIVFKSKEGSFPLALNSDGYFDPNEITGSRANDGFIRLAMPYQDRRIWHLGIALAARELNLDLDNALIQPKKHRIILNGPEGISRVIPIDSRGQFLVDWSLPLKDERLTRDSFESIVNHDLERQLGSNIFARFAGKLVTVGSTATGNELADRGATPLEKDTFLTSNYWNVVNSVLLGRFIHQTPLWVDLLWIAFMGFIAALLTLRLPALWASLSVALLICACVLGSVLLFIFLRWWVPMAMPIGALLFTHGGLLTYQTFFEQNERRRIKNIFTKLVSPSVVNELLNAKELHVSGARGEVTVFFADVRGFTELTERRHAQAEEYVRTHALGPAEAKAYFDQQAQQVLDTINLYLGLLADIIIRREGTLDKYIGDCVMAFWGAPAPHEQHALACVRAAMDAQRAIHNLNQQRASQNKLREQENLRRAARGQSPLPLLATLSLGTGINTGIVTVGLMGSDAHGLNYTVLGREVNLASRLEGYSGHGRIIIGEATYLHLHREDPGLASTCLPIQLSPAALKGFSMALKVFEVPWRINAPAEAKPAEKKFEPRVEFEGNTVSSSLGQEEPAARHAESTKKP